MCSQWARFRPFVRFIYEVSLQGHLCTHNSKHLPYSSLYYPLNIQRLGSKPKYDKARDISQQVLDAYRKLSCRTFKSGIKYTNSYEEKCDVRQSQNRRETSKGHSIRPARSSCVFGPASPKIQLYPPITTVLFLT